jgi:hypothetical protein
MRAAYFGRRRRHTARTAGSQYRHPLGATASRGGEIFHGQLDLFGAPNSADPLLGFAVKLPNTCSKCADLVAIVGPGKPPHSASLLCRSCGTHRGWISRELHVPQRDHQ